MTSRLWFSTELNMENIFNVGHVKLQLEGNGSVHFQHSAILVVVGVCG